MESIIISKIVKVFEHSYCTYVEVIVELTIHETHAILKITQRPQTERNLYYATDYNAIKKIEVRVIDIINTLKIRQLIGEKINQDY